MIVELFENRLISCNTYLHWAWWPSISVSLSLRAPAHHPKVWPKFGRTLRSTRFEMFSWMIRCPHSINNPRISLLSEWSGCMSVDEQPNLGSEEHVYSVECVDHEEAGKLEYQQWTVALLAVCYISQVPVRTNGMQVDLIFERKIGCLASSDVLAQPLGPTATCTDLLTNLFFFLFFREFLSICFHNSLRKSDQSWNTWTPLTCVALL